MYKIYEVHPTNDALTTWTAPIEVFTNALENVIDAFMVKIESTYYLWYKDETNSYIEYATSTSPTSGFTKIKNDNWAGWGSGLEGQSLVQMDSSTWRIYLDRYVALGIYYSDSTDGFQTWSAKALISNNQFTMMHPTIIKTSDIGVFRNILGTFLSNPTGRLTPKSILAQHPSGGTYIEANRYDNTVDASFNSIPSGALSSTNPQWGMGLQSNSAALRFWTWDGTTATVRMTIQDNGNIVFRPNALDATTNYISIDTLDTNTAGPPPSGDCDTSGKVGRIVLATRYTATADFALYVCTQTGASTFAWKKATLS